MGNVSSWSTTASNNDNAPPNGAPENMSPSTVNDSMRENMAAVARWYGDTQGSLVSSGSGNAYTLSTNSNNAALDDQSLLTFRANRANTGSATLAVDGLASKSLVRADGEDLEPGDIQENHMLVVVYNSTLDRYLVISSTKPRDASETIKGVAEIATQDEVDEGDDDTRIVTPQKLQNRLIFTDAFESDEQAIVLDGTGSVEHELSGSPPLFLLYLRCKTSEGGYSVGDEVLVSPFNRFYDGNTNRNRQITVGANSNDVFWSVGDNSVVIARKDNGNFHEITPVNWRIIIRAWV